ncbi:MAG: lysophospholipid acyltransferase family protein [Caulobacteraceae bacterium]
MNLARSLLFVAVFYVWSTLLALAMLPLLLAPRSWMRWAVVGWAASTSVLVRWICGVRVEIRGREHLPTGAALVAAKHQCMFDTMAPYAALPDACYVLRSSLLKIPFYGWYCRKSGMIAVDREGHARALRKLLADARERIAQQRQLVIFPEGTRTAPGESGEYRPGVAALYRELGLACTPLATNSGRHWPAHGFIRRPGVIVYEFLPAIAPGLHRAAFMRLLRERIESASAALLAL